MHIHILGICGTFMGGLALLARAAGHQVSGCDSGVYPPMSTQLAEQGIELIEGYDPSQLAVGADLYVIGNIMRRGNPLVEAILNRGLPYTSGPQWLAQHILHGQHVLAVAGTHGKTTTSSMLAWILQHAGLAPNFLIGGVAPDLEVSARFNPASKYFVIEADEYDTAFFDKRSKFVHYRPRTAILHNLEYDHADIFADLAAIETQFHHLVRTVPGNGLIIRPSQSAALDRVLARGCWTPLAYTDCADGWQVTADQADGSLSTISYEGTACGQLSWQLTGRHNLANALAAIAAAHSVGVDAAASIAALNAFKGVRRRLELRGTVNGIAVYDDFAHHPSAIATTLEGLRQHVGPKTRILAVLEPRSNTMKLGTMAAQLPDALALADLVFCYGAASGPQALGWDPAEVLQSLGARARHSDQLEQIVHAVVQHAQPGDHILVMSNGSFGDIHTRLLEQLGQSKSLAQSKS